MNIYEKMSEAGKKIARVPKNLIVGTGRNQYKAVAEADILAAVKDAEAEQKIFSFPVAHEIVESRTITNKGGEDGRSWEKESRFVRVKTTYRFVNMEKPEEFIEVIGYGDGIDTLDKAPGKAVTYADKYALMKAYKIETGDDPDQNSSDDLEGHDIRKIKERIEKLITQKLNAGVEFSAIAAALNMKEKALTEYMGLYDRLYKFESAVRKL